MVRFEMKKIMYLTGTRADFGLMQSTLALLHGSNKLALTVCITGMHLSSDYGQTATEIKLTKLPICAEIPVNLQDNTGAGMAHSIADVIHGITDVLVTEKPDILMLLGDRGEMLAGAIAALHLNIPVVHIHGGERSGTVDEPVRHAISKMAHYHFVTTPESAKRLIRMGEEENNVHVVGAPGLDAILDMQIPARSVILRELELDPDKIAALIVFHPVVQEADQAGSQFQLILDAVVQAGLQAVILHPNSDAGSAKIRKVIEAHTTKVGAIKICTHLPRHLYLGMLSSADVLIGNSSSGIIEAASFGTPVVNIGSRQNCRERNVNVLDVPVLEYEAIFEAIRKALNNGRYKAENIYGDGCTGARILALLENISMDDVILNKINSY